MADTFESYTTADGDMVDAIAFRRFGTSRAHTERILDANPGLAAMGSVLPAGVVIRIPVPAVPDRKKTAQRLWD
jgi:phage tail protein X